MVSIMKKLKFKFTIFAFILVCAITLCFLLLPSQNKVALASSYFHTENAVAITATDDGIVVFDDNGASLISADGTLLSSVDLTSVTDATSYGNKTFALSNETIYSVDFESGTYQEFEPTKGQTFSHIDTNGNGVYAWSDENITFYPDFGNEPHYFTAVAPVTGIAVTTDEVYYSVFDGKRSSVYTTANELVYDRLDFTSDLCTFNGSLYALNGRGDLILIGDSTTTAVTSGKTIVHICVYGDDLYYLTDRGELYALGSDGTEKIIFASDSSEVGFYSAPKSAVSRFSHTFIADYLNNRVADVSKNGTTYMSFIRPTAVAIDNFNNLFVAHSFGKISIVKDGKITDYYALDGVISALACDNENNLYAQIGAKLIKISNGEKTELADGVTCFTTSFDGSTVYYANGNALKTLDGNTFKYASKTIVSVCLDASGNAFFVIDGTLVRVDMNGKEMLVCELPSSASSVALSKAKTAICDYGDIILVDEDNCRVWAINGAESGVALPSLTPTLTPYDDGAIIRTVLGDCALYATTLEDEVKFNVKKGASVIVAKYDVPQASGLAFCYYEDAISKSLIGGYVFKCYLSDPIEFVSPVEKEGVLYVGSANLYAFPSIYSDKLVEDMPKGTTLTLLDFAPYESNDGKWYKAVTADGKIGYVIKNAVSVRGFVPDAVRPQYNAVIVESNGSAVASVYVKNGNTMVKIPDTTLLIGTKVEVVGSFDTSEKYTKIIYFDEELGSLTCYVETDYIEYNSFSIVQVVAIVIVVVTVALLAFLLIRMYMRKRKI